MRQIRICFCLVVGIFFYAHGSSQTIHENTGWLASFNSYRLSASWGLHFDAQLRSGNDWKNVRNILLRPGITYFINSRNSVTLGYAYVGAYNVNGPKTTLTEHRIWEQYIYNTKLGRTSLQNRFRLEQRFIERQTENVFAQRLRYFIRSVIPLAKQEKSFSMGFFAALQDEIFFNIQNKAKINNSLFDQNRIYFAVGYRFSSKFDAEAGYMNQYTNGMVTDVSNNIIQVAFYTRL